MLSPIVPVPMTLPCASTTHPVGNAPELIEVELSRVDAAFARIASRHAAIVVEGAGGLLVPTTDDETMADLATRLGLPLLLVARAALGTINHTRLSLDAIAARGLDCVGVVISHSDGQLSDADERNLAWLRQWLGDRLLGEIRPLAAGTVPELDAIRLEPFLERLA